MTGDNSKLFDRALLKMRRNRAANNWASHDFLKREAVARLLDSLDDVTRTFTLALDVGCHKGELADVLHKRGMGVVRSDIAESMLEEMPGLSCVCDEELLPFATDTFDVVMSALSLHHVNDLPGTLIQIRQCLKPDGLFLAMLPGAKTLQELRESVTGASAEHGFALSPRHSPLLEVRDAGALLQRAGFALPVADSDIITVEYDNPFRLMQDLHGMGESNVLLGQHKAFTTAKHMAAIADYYQRHFGRVGGTIPATFEFITMTGWKPHASQQQPAKRGSGTVNLTRVL